MATVADPITVQRPPATLFDTPALVLLRTELSLVPSLAVALRNRMCHSNIGPLLRFGDLRITTVAICAL